jgi:hypothetical protein
VPYAVGLRSRQVEFNQRAGVLVLITGQANRIYTHEIPPVNVTWRKKNLGSKTANVGIRISVTMRAMAQMRIWTPLELEAYRAGLATKCQTGTGDQKENKAGDGVQSMLELLPHELVPSHVYRLPDGQVVQGLDKAKQWLNHQLALRNREIAELRTQVQMPERPKKRARPTA